MQLGDRSTPTAPRRQDQTQHSESRQHGHPERVQPHDVRSVLAGRAPHLTGLRREGTEVLDVQPVRANPWAGSGDESHDIVTHLIEGPYGLVGHRGDAAAAKRASRSHHEYLHGSSMAAPPLPPRDVDAIVVSWNSEPHLGAALGALPGWVGPLVVDNASADGSAAVAERHGAHVVRLPTNLGFAAGVNRGLDLVQAPFVLLLNPDLVIEEEALHRLLDALQRDPSVGLVGPATVDASGEPEPAAARRDRTALQILIESIGLVHLSRQFDRQMIHDRRRSQDVDAVNGACMLLRTDLLRSLDGLDDTLFMYLEDMDLCRRLRDAGYRVRFVADAPARHEGGASTARGDRDEQARAYLHRIDADVEFLRRYGRPGAAGAAVAAYVFRSLVGCLVTLVWRDRAVRYRAALRYSWRLRRGGTRPAPV
jgi:GT2 family glycosyltransferase